MFTTRKESQEGKHLNQEWHWQHPRTRAHHGQRLHGAQARERIIEIDDGGRAAARGGDMGGEGGNAEALLATIRSSSTDPVDTPIEPASQ